MGSNLGVIGSDIVEVTINDVSCDVNNQLYQPGVRYEVWQDLFKGIYYIDIITTKPSFTCVTGPTASGSYSVISKISYLMDRIMSEDTVKFSYKV